MIFDGTKVQDELFFETETRKHQQEVGRFMMRFAQAILERAAKHDASKLEEPERAIFIEYTPKLKGSTYGSDAYMAFLREMEVALDHHYSHNPHHPEYHLGEYPVQGMTLLDMVEMLCDWLAATKRHADGDIYKSININEKRFKMDGQVAQLLRNSVGMLEG